MSWVFQNIESLLTPCGEVLVTDDAGNKCLFSVKLNPYSPDYHLFSGTAHEELVNTDTNYLLCIKADSLLMGHTYKVFLLGNQLHFGDSDEHTEAVSGTFDGFSIAIGSYDPNDDEKLHQAHQYSQEQGFHDMIVSPPRYDVERFMQYEVEMLDNESGFSFRLLDKSVKEIVFPIAWVKHKYIGLPDYEAAVELWTT